MTRLKNWVFFFFFSFLYSTSIIWSPPIICQALLTGFFSFFSFSLQLQARYHGQGTVKQIHMPANTITIGIEFQAKKVTKIVSFSLDFLSPLFSSSPLCSSFHKVGDLATEEPEENDELEGYVVQKDLADPIMLAPADLDIFTNLSSTRITQRQVIFETTCLFYFYSFLFFLFFSFLFFFTTNLNSSSPPPPQK